MSAISRHIILVLLVFGCTGQQRGFKIDGTATGISDSTEIFLHDPATRKKIDSALIRNERFEFSGVLSESVKQVVIATKDWRDYKLFWLENTDVTFKAEKGNFRSGLIRGLPLQQAYDRFLAQQMPLQKTYDSLFNISDGNFSPAERRQINQRMLDLQKKITEMEKKFVRDNPGSVISAYMLDIYKTTWGHAVARELFAPLKADVKRSYYGKNIVTFLSLNRDLQIGDHFVDFELPDTNGEKVKASDFSGKYLLIEFWASWCGPCRRENPGMVELYREHQGKGFEILAVSLDTEKAAWMEAIEKDGLPWYNVSNLTGDMTDAAMIYGVAAIPDNVLIDPSGKIIGRNLRGEELEKELKKIFNMTMAYGK